MENELNGAAVDTSASHPSDPVGDNYLPPAAVASETLALDAQPSTGDLAPPPPLDEVDRWFAQGDAMRAALLRRREDLLRQLALTDERLAVLGVPNVSAEPSSPLEGVDLDAVRNSLAVADTPAKAKRGRKAKAAKKKRVTATAANVASSISASKLFDALTVKPATLDVIAKKVKVDRLLVRQALLVLHAEGKVKRSGIGGALYSRAA